MDNRELKKILDKLYKMYIYDEEVCTIKDNEAVSKITDKLIELDEKFIKTYNEHLLKEDDFKDILEEYFYTYNEMTCAYRKNDFREYMDLSSLVLFLPLTKDEKGNEDDYPIQADEGTKSRRTLL